MKKRKDLTVHILLPPLARQAIEWLARQEGVSTTAMARRLMLRGLRETLNDEEKALLKLEQTDLE